MKPRSTKPGTKRQSRSRSSNSYKKAVDRFSKPKVDNRDPLGAPVEYDRKYCAMIVAYAKRPEGYTAAFAALIGVGLPTIYAWRDKHPEFAEALARARAVNEIAMVKIGLDGMRGKLRQGAWQGAWTFMMKARHGWREDGPKPDDDDNDVEFDFGS